MNCMYNFRAVTFTKIVTAYSVAASSSSTLIQ